MDFLPPNLDPGIYVLAIIAVPLASIVVSVIQFILSRSESKKSNAEVKKVVTNNHDEIKKIVDDAIDGSHGMQKLWAFVTSQQERLDTGDKHFEKSDKEHTEIKQMIKKNQCVEEETRLMLLRQDLFMPTTDRAMHEHQINSGEEYTTHGGNGIGHVRLSLLKEDYRRRQKEDDWNYEKKKR